MSSEFITGAECSEIKTWMINYEYRLKLKIREYVKEQKFHERK